MIFGRKWPGCACCTLSPSNSTPPWICDELLPRSSTACSPRSAPRGDRSGWPRVTCCAAGSRWAGGRAPGGRADAGRHGFVGDVVQNPRTTMVIEAVKDPRFRPPPIRSKRPRHQTSWPRRWWPGRHGRRDPGDQQGTGDGDVRPARPRPARGPRRRRRRRAAERPAARRGQRAGDLAVLLDISREITATLDLDRVLQSVVNLASRALAVRPRRGRAVREGALRHPGGGRRGDGGPQGPQAAGPGGAGRVGGGPR